jgi:hypothetical protein
VNQQSRQRGISDNRDHAVGEMKAQEPLAFGGRRRAVPPRPTPVPPEVVEYGEFNRDNGRRQPVPVRDGRQQRERGDLDGESSRADAPEGADALPAGQRARPISR